jgi:hypothetical protein
VATSLPNKDCGSAGCSFPLASATCVGTVSLQDVLVVLTLVRDLGIGIFETDQPKILGRFFRREWTRREDAQTEGQSRV